MLPVNINFTCNISNYRKIFCIKQLHSDNLNQNIYFYLPLLALILFLKLYFNILISINDMLKLVRCMSVLYLKTYL